jgi:hypothetical protein
MRKKEDIHGQIKMSFGMIFSIILIIVFLAFAFFAIKKFLNFQSSVKILQFVDDLQTDVEKMWKSPHGSYSGGYSLPLRVTSVCFVDDDYENLIFNSKEYIEGRHIEHIDMEKTLEGRDSLCFSNVNGEVIIIIKKDYEDALVTLAVE